ncbi:RNA methyltransferase [Flavobacteriales bacterium]|nr:RNA methyltransferase [Flavobacteriales bacterium]
MPEITKNQLKHIRLLKQKKYRQEFGEFLVEGEKNVDELLKSKFKINAIYATSEWNDTNYSELTTLITVKQLSQISNLSSPNKVVALAQIPKTEYNESILQNDLTLVLDTINDPGNLGTIIRTADWFGIENIICSTESVDCYNPKVVQTTKGSLFNVNIHYQDLPTLLLNTKIKIYGAALDGEEIKKGFIPQKPAVLLMGSESHGISEDLEKIITDKILIKQKGKAESLNVAIATSILLYQFTS